MASCAGSDRRLGSNGKIWDHTFGNELRIDISKCNSLFVTESFGNPKANREKMATIFFETFGINKLGIGN